MENTSQLSISTFRSWHYGLDSSLVDPIKNVKDLNEKIGELHLKKALAETIVACASAIILSLASIWNFYMGTVPLIFCGIICLIMSPILVLDVISEYKKQSGKYFEIKQKIERLAREFLYLDKYTIDADLSLNDLNRIRPYICEDKITPASICLSVHRQSHYVISGGEIHSWSIQPLSLNAQKISDNQEGVLKEYKPWIHLLLEVEKCPNIPESLKKNLGVAIGCMIHKPVGLFAELDYNLNFGLEKFSTTVTTFYYDKGKIIHRKNGQNFEYDTSESLAQILPL